MKTLFVVSICAISLMANAATPLSEKTWIHGSKDCATNRDPAIEVFEFDADTYVLRQNKCLNYEAPFIYVLFGEQIVFVQDTGATEEFDRFPLYDIIQSIVVKRGNKALKMLVTHSHGHGDHTAADSQFRGRPGVTLVEANDKAVREHFGFTNWPNGIAKVELGGRTLEVMPIPGHHDQSVAVYDPRTQWLLTGDTVYPGRLYVKDWNMYRASIAKLADYAKSHTVLAVMGTHIEMSSTGMPFPPGSNYQPGEAPLPLTVQDLTTLKSQLDQAGDEPIEIATPKFVVTPIGFLQRVISTVMGWFS
jgi:hydroxyacylglutathione hydrolase